MSEFPVVTRYEVVGAQDVIRTNAELWQSFKQGNIDVKDFSTALRENMEGTYAMRRAYSGMRMAIRVEMAPLIESARVLQDIGSIGRDVVQMWQAYTIGQLRIERAARDVVDAQQEVAKWQQLYNQYLRDFGLDSATTKDASENLISAYKKLKEANDAAAKAQRDMWMGYAGMALEIGGVVGQIANLAVHIAVLKATIAATTGAEAAGLFGTGLTAAGLGAAALAAAPPIAAVGAGYWLAQQIQPVGKGEQEYASFAEAAADLGITFEQLKTEMLETVETNKSFGGSMDELIKYMQEYNALAGGGMAVQYSVGGKYGMITLSPEEWKQLQDLIKGQGQYGIPYVQETGYYKLHKGEQVLNPEQTRTEQRTLREYEQIIRETAHEQVPTEMLRISHGQLGIDYVPQNMLIYAHKGERLLSPEQTRRENVVKGNRPIMANVTQYNTITKTADADAAADRAYQKLLKKFADKS
jgi:hypothetical protein